MDELCWLTAIELRTEIQKRNIGIEELTCSYLKRRAIVERVPIWVFHPGTGHLACRGI